MKGLVLLILAHVHRFGNNMFACMEPDVFNDKCKKEFSQQIQNLTSKNPLHMVLKNNGKVIGRGSFGEVKSFEGVNEELVMKFQHPKRPESVMCVSNEITMMKVACGRMGKELINEFIDCEGAGIAPFKGCVQDGKDVFIFQRRAFSDLENDDLLERYQSFEPIARAVVMLKILDQVVKLHSKHIIHSDIKPANVVTRTADLQEFELIDLGMAGFKQTSFRGGSFGYLPPEMSSDKDKLSPLVDVYSLGITLLYLEKGFIELTNEMEKKCFKFSICSKCHEKLLKAIPKTLVPGRGLNELTPVFAQAIAYDSSMRLKTVEIFSQKIVEILMKNPYFKCYLSSLVLEEEQKGKITKKDPPYSWMAAVRKINEAAGRSGNLLISGKASDCEGFKRKNSNMSTQSTESKASLSNQSSKNQQQNSASDDEISDVIDDKGSTFVVRNPGDQFLGKKRPGANLGTPVSAKKELEETPEEKELNQKILEYLNSPEKFTYKPNFSQTKRPSGPGRILGDAGENSPLVV